MREFVADIQRWEDGAEEPTLKGKTILEVSEAEADGIEVNFADPSGGRVYLKFRLDDLVRATMSRAC